MKNLPAGCGKVISADVVNHGIPAANFYVQTPDALWSIMIDRMRQQVTARDVAMSAWEKERDEKQGRRYPDEAYWTAYYTKKARHRVDYPMPWEHVMFLGRE